MAFDQNSRYGLGAPGRSYLSRLVRAKATDRLGQLWNLDRFSPTRRVTFQGPGVGAGYSYSYQSSAALLCLWLPLSSSNCCQDTWGLIDWRLRLWIDQPVTLFIDSFMSRARDPTADDEIIVTDHTIPKERESRPSSRNSSHKVL